jgi:hypothetical protein
MSTDRIDEIMERASHRLTATEYAACEQLCLEALDLARQQEDFDRYARILLPLQEARRQRRQIAADAGVTVLAGPRREPRELIETYTVGCLLLVRPPYAAEDEHELRRLAVERSLYVEALALDQDGLRQAFEQQMEREGDAALARISRDLDPVRRVDALAEVVHRVGDHEIAHQRLAEAARHAARQKAAQADHHQPSEPE